MLTALVVGAIAQAATDHWAVLVAGSSGYGNYRHQADVCHAYQVVLSKGVPASNIIVMAVDDIAGSRENPYPGQVFNAPTPKGTPGVDVYKNCKIDWRGRDVTPDNFVKVLTGVTTSNSTKLSSPNKPMAGDCTKRQATHCIDQETATCCCTARMFFTCSHYQCCKKGYSCDGNGGCQPGPGPTPPPGPSPTPPPGPPSHKVLGSGSNSKVFINFVDHGAVGLIGFPSSTLHVKELSAALKTMHDKKMYKELVFYLEACESGSMFPDGTLQPGMYATTAANAKESSWGTYCRGDDAEVDGKPIGSCLGDLYSVNWMEDSDKGVDGETIEEQFEKVKKLTTKSHVQEFKSDPDTISSQPLDNFQGNKDDSALVEAVGTAPSDAADADLKRRSTIDSRDAEVESAYSRFMATGSAAAAHELIAGVQDRLAVDSRFAAITHTLGLDRLLGSELPAQIDWDCHFEAHQAYVGSCGEWSNAALKHSATLAKLCAESDAATIRAAIDAACAK